MTAHRQTSRKALLASACAGLFAYGVMVSLLGATLPELQERLNFGIDRGGTLFSILYVSQIFMVFVGGLLIDRFGKKPALAGGSLLSAAALVGMAYAPTYAVLGAMLLLLGLGGSFMMTGGNTLVPELYPDNPSSALNLGTVFFGLGAVFSPLVFTLLAMRLGLGLERTLLLIALMVAALAAVAFSQTFPLPRAAGGFDWTEARQVALDPAVINLAIVLVFYSGLEIGTGGWIRTYLEQEFGVTGQGSGLRLTLFWTALMVGRVIASQILRWMRGPQLVLFAAMGAFVGLLLVSTARSVDVATLGIVIAGLCYAPVFPTTAGTANTYFPKLFGTVFGVIMATGLIGGMVLPAAIGYIAKGTTVRTALWLLVGTAFLLILTQLIFLRYERRRFLATPLPTAAQKAQA